MLDTLASPHLLDVQDVFNALKTSEDGLSEQEVARRQAVCGENRLPLAPPKSARSRFLDQIHNVLI